MRPLHAKTAYNTYWVLRIQTSLFLGATRLTVRHPCAHRVHPEGEGNTEGEERQGTRDGAEDRHAEFDIDVRGDQAEQRRERRGKQHDRDDGMASHAAGVVRQLFLIVEEHSENTEGLRGDATTSRRWIQGKGVDGTRNPLWSAPVSW